MKKIVAALFIIFPFIIMGQTTPSQSENYILQKVYQVPLLQPQVEMLPNNSSSNNKKIETIVYYDGLGRSKQNIALRSGGSEEDVITLVEYDTQSRKDHEYLPYPKPNNHGALVPDPLLEQNNYYLLNFPEDAGPNGTINSFAKKLYESSPDNRIIKQGAPGIDWQIMGTSSNDHTIKFEYGTNTLSDEVKLFKVSFLGGNREIPQLTTSDFYEPTSLYKNIVKNENWTGGNDNTTQEFINKQDQLILRRTFNDAVKHDTYYVYDDFGKLTYVHSPNSSPLIVGSVMVNITSTDIIENGENLSLFATQTVTLKDGFHAKSGSDLTAKILPETQEIIDELSYSYRYDKRNRLYAKKLPGKGWELIIYNKLNQPILTQDSNLRVSNEWLFTKYDAFGRVVYTGLMNDPYTNEPDVWERRKLIQEDVNAQTQLVETTGNSTLDGINTYWTNNAYPQTNINSILVINYYDHYNWDNSGISNPGTVLGTAITTNTQSLKTGKKVRVLGTNNWITTVNFYDEKARLIYYGSKNEFLSTLEIYKSKLDFVGKVMEDETLHTKGGSTIQINNIYTYDQVGSLITKTQSVNNGLRELIVNNSYDELGKLENKKIGGPVATIPENSSGLQTIDYNYNIRGWLKEINDVSNMGTDLFAFKIDYNEGTNPLYNGNISRTEWKTKSLNPTSNPVSASYNYTYDALNRIKTALDNTDHYGLTFVDYDKNGNILQLDRQGHTDQNATQFGEMDKLSYSYGNGNDLLKVVDIGNDLYGFVDGYNTDDDYEYDSNGNLIKDANKGITKVLYNYLNLPSEIKFNNSNNQKISYIYSANGTKLQKVTNNNGNIITTDYADNFLYENGMLKQFFHSEGYTKPDGNLGFDYFYNYLDHVGNVRLNFRDINESGTIEPLSEIVEERNFYPFGLEHKGYNNLILGEENNYKTFQGQELQENLGLNVLEFKWRTHDPTISRFWQIDPLAEDFVYNSTYSFSENSPIAFVELEGLEKVLAIYYHGGPFGGGAPTTVGEAGYTGQYYNNTQSFSQSAGREFQGLLIAPGFTSNSGVETGINFIKENYCTGDQVIVYGYSYGTDLAVDLAEQLGASGIGVDILITVDGSDGFLQNTTVNTVIPDNVDLNLNIYQTSNSGSSSSSRSTGLSSSDSSSGSSSSDSGTSNSPGSNGGPNSATDSDKTTIVNKDVTGPGVNHGNIQQKAETIVQTIINTRIYLYKQNK